MPQDEIPNLVWDLANRLLAQTNKGSVKWAATDNDYGFIYSGSSAAVVVESLDQDGQEPYRLVLFDSNGGVVDSFGVTENTPREWDNLLASLYGAARRSVTNTDPLLRSLIKDLSVTDVDDLPF